MADTFQFSEAMNNRDRVYGLAGAPRHGADTAAVLHAANRALYLATTSGQGRKAMAQLWPGNGRVPPRPRARAGIRMR